MLGRIDVIARLGGEAAKNASAKGISCAKREAGQLILMTQARNDDAAERIARVS